MRCAYHLGSANPGMAQISAYKSILLSVITSFFCTAVLFLMGEFFSNETIEKCAAYCTEQNDQNGHGVDAGVCVLVELLQ